MRRLLATVVIALVLAGCGGAEADGDPAAQGSVLEVQDAGDPIVFTLNTPPENNLNGAVITVAVKNLVGAEDNALERGDAVKVWTKVCTQSIPAQCEATRVEVTGK